MKHFFHRHPFAAKTATLLAALVVTAGFTGCRGGGHGHFGANPEKRAEKMVERVSDELDLTAEQKASLETLKNELLADFKKERETHLEMAAEIEKQIAAPQLDQAKIKALLTERHARMQAKMEAALPKVAAFHASLTPEQKQKALEHIKEMRERFGKRQ